MIIELVGLPGSGKSTVVAHFLKEVENDCLTRENLREQPRIEHMKRQLHALVLLLVSVVGAVKRRDILMVKKLTERRTFMNLYYAGLVRAFYMEKTRCNQVGEPIVFDQGIFQALSILHNIDSDSSWNKYIRVLVGRYCRGVPMGVVRLDSRLEDSVRRVKQRRELRAWFDALPTDRIKKICEQQRAGLETLIAIGREEGIPIFIIPEDTSILEKVVALHRIVDSSASREA